MIKIGAFDNDRDNQCRIALTKLLMILFAMRGASSSRKKREREESHPRESHLIDSINGHEFYTIVCHFPLFLWSDTERGGFDSEWQAAERKLIRPTERFSRGSSTCRNSSTYCCTVILLLSARCQALLREDNKRDVKRAMTPGVVGLFRLRGRRHLACGKSILRNELRIETKWFSPDIN